MALTSTTPRPLDLTALRDAFPALQRRHHDQPVAYLDSPGGTQVPRVVAEAMTDYLLHHNANTHWVYPTSVETDAIIMAAREAVADLLGASPREVAFGQNMTTLTFHLARALGRRLGPGDEIVVTALDHHSNLAPWRAIEKERGVTLRMAEVHVAQGVLDLDDLARKVTPRTRVLAIGAASNALGTISDVRRAADLAHAVGAVCFVDAVHYAPHRLVDVAALGCDFLACSAYKFYGPHQGVLFGREDLIAGLDAPKLDPAPDTAPDRLETGTQNHEAMAGTRAAIDFLAGFGRGATRRQRLASVYDDVHAHTAALFAELWRGLAAIPGVKLFGPPPEGSRTPTAAFTVAGLTSEQAAERLAARGLFVSHGDFYASTIVGRLGLADAGLVRVGLAAYTSAEEVERLVAGVKAVARP